jgi:nitrate reductase gamma subunit
MTMLLDVFREEANAFFAGFFILIVLLMLTVSGAYLVEHDAQADKFGSIPNAMWWGAVLNMAAPAASWATAPKSPTPLCS